MQIRPLRPYEADPFEIESPRAPHILVVEDDNQAADTVSLLLGLDGFQVTLATDGRSALDIAASGTIDAVVLDLLLPDIDGFEVCRRLRADRSTASLAIIALSGLDDARSKEQAVEDGADDYLVKPVTSRQLCSRLRRLLDRNAGRIRRVGEPETDEDFDTTEPTASPAYQLVNNPLTAALGRVTVLLASSDLSPDVRRNLDECQQQLIAVDRLLRRAKRAADAKPDGEPN